jgi:KUP system potassium uptake protein
MAALTLGALGVVVGDIGTSLSRIAIVATDAPGMSHWRKRLSIAIARNAANPVAYFGLPDQRTVVLSAYIEL